MNEKELRILLNGLQDGSVTIDKCVDYEHIEEWLVQTEK